MGKVLGIRTLAVHQRAGPVFTIEFLSLISAFGLPLKTGPAYGYDRLHVYFDDGIGGFVIRLITCSPAAIGDCAIT